MKVFKNIRNHWQAVTETELSADMVLRIVTIKKHSGYTGTTVTAMKREKGCLVGLTMLNAIKFILGAIAFYGSLWLMLVLGSIAGF
jgi:hypothetical protein